MIRAIFYSKFDVHEGPKVVHQVPIESITTSSNSPGTPLIHWPSISSAIIPRQSFCSLSIALLAHPYRVLSHPICLTSPVYPRNEFIFSFSLVLHHKTATPAYTSVVSKLASLFKHLEETSRFLSKDVSPPNTGRIYALCEILLEDLNNYCETMIPIDESNTLNIKLFPTYPPPPPLKHHYVPLPTVKLADLTDPNWDLTMLAILPFLDGVNSVEQVARKADADYELVEKAIEHLLYYGCVTLLDVFSFGACYAPTAGIGTFVGDGELQEECRRFVLHQDDHGHGGTGDEVIVDGMELVELYCSLKQGLTLRTWCMDHAEIMGIIDVRRLITFGIIKGILYRVHKYALATGPLHKIRVTARGGDSNEDDLDLARFLDGTHCFDEMCTRFGISERELTGRLKAVGDIQIIQK